MHTRRLMATAALLATASVGAAAGQLTGAAATTAPASKSYAPDLAFNMVRSTGTPADCLPRAKARVRIYEIKGAEKMVVSAQGLRPNTEYDLFVTQVPNLPFGLSWYQGDVESNGRGKAQATFIGRFNQETFTVAPGTAPAPVVHDSPIADAASNPATAPVHQYHLGLWFNSPDDAEAAGCAPAVTPFNGEHNAGVQILSTRQFADDQGPLRQLEG